MSKIEGGGGGEEEKKEEKQEQQQSREKTERDRRRWGNKGIGVGEGGREGEAEAS